MKALTPINYGFKNKQGDVEYKTFAVGDTVEGLSDADVKSLKEARALVEDDVFDRFNTAHEDKLASGVSSDVAGQEARAEALAHATGDVSQTTDPEKLRAEMVAAAKDGAFKSTDPEKNPPISQSHTAMDEQVFLTGADVKNLTGQATGDEANMKAEASTPHSPVATTTNATGTK